MFDAKRAYSQHAVQVPLDTVNVEEAMVRLATRAVVHGLKGRTEWNQLHCTLLAPLVNSEDHRWLVCVQAPGYTEVVKMKAANLRLSISSKAPGVQAK